MLSNIKQITSIWNHTVDRGSLAPPPDDDDDDDDDDYSTSGILAGAIFPTSAVVIVHIYSNVASFTALTATQPKP